MYSLTLQPYSEEIHFIHKQNSEERTGGGPGSKHLIPPILPRALAPQAGTLSMSPFAIYKNYLHPQPPGQAEAFSGSRSSSTNSLPSSRTLFNSPLLSPLHTNMFSISSHLKSI